MNAFLAIDWGTTNRRIYRIEDGMVALTARDDRGVRMMAQSDYETAIGALRAKYGDLPMLLAGMVGSSIGWYEAPYVKTPAGLPALAANLLAVDPRTAIVPGLSHSDGSRADIMRGEEVQLLGAGAASIVPETALLCQPGTHCKWARLEHGQIVDFQTTMTGELFALLRTHSILAPQLTAPVGDGSAFHQGVVRGARGDLLAALFEIRAAGLQGSRPDDANSSYASGLLIGADIAMRMLDDPDVYILAEPPLGGLYETAIRTLGGRAFLVDSQAAFVAGIVGIWEQHQ